MKTFRTILTPVAALFLFACGGPLEANLGDETGSADADAGADAGAKPDTGSETPQPSGAVDNDGDGVTAAKDCNDNNALVHPWAPEICNGKDDNCNIVADEGCPAQQPQPSGSQCVDNDHDNFCTVLGPVDCNDQDANVKPGAPEACNGKDDDCDGTIDEGCGVNPPASDGTTATFTISYPDAVTRTLSVQPAASLAAFPGTGWWKSETSSATSVSLSLEHVQANHKYFRLNVTEGSPGASWLCAGNNKNGGSPSLDPDAGVGITVRGKAYTKAHLTTWSDPSGNGCSALLTTTD